MTSLRGERVQLRPARDADVPALVVLRNDEPLQALLMARHQPNTPERVRAWLDDRAARTDMVFFVIADAGDDSVLGYVQVAAVDRTNGSGDLGICVAPAAQGRSVAAEASALLERHLVEALGLRKLVLRVLAGNGRAVAFYRKHGWREVGTLRAHHVEAGVAHDVLLMEKFLGR